jgi:DNA-directed RNA polymerase subunit RPC12/RpoP
MIAIYACQHCGAELAFEGVRTALCPYCASPNIVERVATPGHAVVAPRFVVAFAHDAAHARASLDRWLGARAVARWFTDGALRGARVEDLRGIYVPAYLYSARAHTAYTASIGEHYTETEEYETRDAQGHKKTETRRVTRTEYRALDGDHVGYITDVLVSASAGLAHRELAALEPFDLLHLRRYTPAVIAGFLTEEFSRSADECARASRADATDEIGARLKRFMPGDSHSDLEWRTAVSWESLDPLLVPVWVLAVRYRADRPALRVVINGQTGKVCGRAPLVWWKIAVAVAVLAAAVVAIVLATRGEPAPPVIRSVEAPPAPACRQVASAPVRCPGGPA